MQIRGVSPTIVVNPTIAINFEQQISFSTDSQAHITIDSESMQVDSTQVTVDKSEDPFKYFGPTIVANIVSYSSSSEEEEKIKDVSQKGDEVVSIEKTVVETKVTTSTSTPITPITPSTPPALVVQV